MAAIAYCQSVTGADGLHFAFLCVLIFLCVHCVKPLTLARKSKDLTQRTRRKEEDAENFIFDGAILPSRGRNFLARSGLRIVGIERMKLGVAILLG